MFGEPEGNDCPFDDLGVSGEEEFSLDDTNNSNNRHVAPVVDPQPTAEMVPILPVAPTLPTIGSTIQTAAPIQVTAPIKQQTASLSHNPFASEDDDFTLQSGSFEVDSASSPPPEEPAGVLSAAHAPEPPAVEPPQQSVQPLLVSALATRSSSSDATAATSTTKSAPKVVPKPLEHNPFAAVADDDPFGSDEQSGGSDFFGGGCHLPHPEAQPAHTLFYEQAPPVLQPSPSYGQSLPPNAFSGNYVPTNAFQTHSAEGGVTMLPPQAPPAHVAQMQNPFALPQVPAQAPQQQFPQSQHMVQPQLANQPQQVIHPQQVVPQQQGFQHSAPLPPQIPMFFSPSCGGPPHGTVPTGAQSSQLPSTLTPQHIMTHRDNHAAHQQVSQSPVMPPQLPPFAGQALPPQAPQFSSTPNTPSMSLAVPGGHYSQQQASVPTTVSPNFAGQRSSSAVSQHSFSSTATPLRDDSAVSPFAQQQQHLAQPQMSTQAGAQLPPVPTTAALGPSVYHRQQHQRQQSDSAIPHHPEAATSASMFYQNSAVGAAGHVSHRSDSAPLYHHHAHHHFSHNTSQFAQPHPSAAAMPPRAESQHFFPQSEIHNNAARQPFVPQVQQHFAPQAQSLQQQHGQQTSFQPQQQQQWGGSFNPANSFQSASPEDEAFTQLFEARKRGCSAVLGFGGRIFMAAGSSVATMTLQSALTATESETTFPTAAGRKYAQEFSLLPGCLTPSTKPDVVHNALANCNSLPLLVSLLQAMCSKSMDWAKGGQQEIMRIMQEAIRMSSGNASLPVWNPAAPASWGQQEAFSTIQQLLAAGDRAQAVRCAMHYKLHSHALMIALMCDTKDVYQQVVQAIIQDDLLSSSPLAFAYSAFNELPCPEIPEGEKGMLLSQWMQHVEMLVANFTREAGEGLLQWGDRLLEDGQWESAHVCYLIAQLSPAARVNPQQPSNPRAQQVVEALRSRYLLLGGQYNRTLCRAALVRPRTVFLTEALEYSRQRENEKFVRAQLIPFRVMMAEMYCELGLVSQAESYLAHVARLLPSVQPRKDDPSARSVAEVVDVLRKRISLFAQLGSSSQGGGQKSGGAGWWPFSKPTQSGTPTAPQQPGAKPSTTTLQATGNISRASSANPIASSRPSSSPPPQQPPLQPKPVAATPTGTKQEPDPTEPQPQKSRWGLGGLFRRSASQQQQAQQKAKEEKEAKEMIIDTDEPPQFDPASGRWLFKKSAEELAIEQQVKAGPPKMGALPQQQQQMPPPNSFQGPPTMTAPPSMGYAPSPTGSAGMPPPPPPPGNMAMGTQRRYIDAFNS